MLCIYIWYTDYLQFSLNSVHQCVKYCVVKYSKSSLKPKLIAMGVFSHWFPGPGHWLRSNQSACRVVHLRLSLSVASCPRLNNILFIDETSAASPPPPACPPSSELGLVPASRPSLVCPQVQPSRLADVYSRPSLACTKA
jgi:hypothetical protein